MLIYPGEISGIGLLIQHGINMIIRCVDFAKNVELLRHIAN